MAFIISLDPAQLRDWSAVAVVDMQYRPQERRFTYNLVAMNRKQGLPYDKIVEWVVQIARRPEFNIPQPGTVILDATGVGIAVNDMFRAKRIRTRAVTITAGNTLNRQEATIHLGKARLIGTFLGAFDSGKVHVNPNMPIWPALEKEMLSFRAEMSVQGNAKFEAAPGEHDDMLFSLALAVWYGEEIKRGGKL